ncbi:unnamed protein product [Cyprideis torosa]|uniref:Ion transport domain-containing protein n=1 Tax=Cyprideis torosa TaxID=163714 RepID=A0A7R8W872_9CRUS|nr:unnamed protein product [Cyprideis torosa]CAG0883999.1 unnamed protein product [Cyprideis torosa]
MEMEVTKKGFSQTKVLHTRPTPTVYPMQSDGAHEVVPIHNASLPQDFSPIEPPSHEDMYCSWREKAPPYDMHQTGLQLAAGDGGSSDSEDGGDDLRRWHSGDGAVPQFGEERMLSPCSCLTDDRYVHMLRLVQAEPATVLSRADERCMSPESRINLMASDSMVRRTNVCAVQVKEYSTAYSCGPVDLRQFPLDAVSAGAKAVTGALAGGVAGLAVGRVIPQLQESLVEGCGAAVQPPAVCKKTTYEICEAEAEQYEYWEEGEYEGEYEEEGGGVGMDIDPVFLNIKNTDETHVLVAPRKLPDITIEGVGERGGENEDEARMSQRMSRSSGSRNVNAFQNYRSKRWRSQGSLRRGRQIFPAGLDATPREVERVPSNVYEGVRPYIDFPPAGLGLQSSKLQVGGKWKPPIMPIPQFSRMSYKKRRSSGVKTQKQTPQTLLSIQNQASNNQSQQKQFSNNQKQFSNNQKQLSNNQKQFSNNQQQLSNNQKQLSNNQKQFSNNQKQLSNSQKLLSNSQKHLAKLQDFQQRRRNTTATPTFPAQRNLSSFSLPNSRVQAFQTAAPPFESLRGRNRMRRLSSRHKGILKNQQANALAEKCINPFTRSQTRSGIAVAGGDAKKQRSIFSGETKSRNSLSLNARQLNSLNEWSRARPSPFPVPRIQRGIGMLQKGHRMQAVREFRRALTICPNADEKFRILRLISHAYRASGYASLEELELQHSGQDLSLCRSMLERLADAPVSRDTVTSYRSSWMGEPMCLRGICKKLPHPLSVSGCVETCQILMQRGAYANAGLERGLAPLKYAKLWSNRQTLSILALLTHGANVDITDDKLKSPLHCAIGKGNRVPDCTAILLNHKAEDSIGYTVLHYAALCEMNGCVKLLLGEGADATIKTSPGVSALSYIIRKTPGALNELKKMFDDGITLAEGCNVEKDGDMKMNFKPLLPNLTGGEVVTTRGEVVTRLFMGLIQCGQRWLPLHPLCEGFLHLILMLFTVDCLKDSYGPSEILAVTKMDSFLPPRLYHIAAISILLAWVELMLMIGRFPSLGVYVQMFTIIVVKHFVKFFVAYVWLIMVFVFSFCILFHNKRPHQATWEGLASTLVMVTGEYEYVQNLFYEEDFEIQFPHTARIIFILFLFIVSVVMMSLLVGVAVSDIHVLHRTTRLEGKTRTIDRTHSPH